MKNIVIFNKKGKSKLETLLLKEADYSATTNNFEQIKDSEELKPDLIILDGTKSEVEEVLVRTKFLSPLLVASEAIPDMMVRSDGYDYISEPVNGAELMIRVANMLKIKELKEKINLVSSTDELTGLYNRACLHQRLSEELARSKRYNLPLSCILFDIDFFKTVNDMYGYDWGDVLLKQVTEVLKRRIRKEDILTRYGDEEFILVLPNTSESNCKIFAERLRKDIEEMEFIPEGEEEKHPITVSAGISSYPFLSETDEDANSLIRYSEHALYSAKQRGKNQVVLFSQMNLEL